MQDTKPTAPTAPTTRTARVILVDDSAIVRQVLQARKSRVAAERERLGAAP